MGLILLCLLAFFLGLIRVSIKLDSLSLLTISLYGAVFSVIGVIVWTICIFII